MIDHTGIGVADVERSAIFYDAALEALGMRRVRQMPETWVATASATVLNILSFGSIATTRTPLSSIPRSQPRIGLRLKHSTPPPSRLAEPKTGRPACAGRITTPHLCSIQTVTTSRTSSVVTEAFSQGCIAG
jgi:catechol 2,3-dioxygenase-like lactoylglutathione lyase family enzyme